MKDEVLPMMAWVHIPYNLKSLVDEKGLGRDEADDLCPECSGKEASRLNAALGIADGDRSGCMSDGGKGGFSDDSESLATCSVCGCELACTLVGPDFEGWSDDDCCIETKDDYDRAVARLQKEDEK